MENGKYYNFRNDTSFIESGNLRKDLYTAIKQEVGYFILDKYKVYMDKMCETFEDKLSSFYGDIASILLKLKQSLLDEKISDLSNYVEYLRKDFNPRLYSESSARNTSIMIMCLDKIDILLNRLVYDIINKQEINKLSTSRGIFVLINQYFEKADNPIFESFGEFVDNCYGIVYENVRITRKDMIYGKKY